MYYLFLLYIFDFSEGHVGSLDAVGLDVDSCSSFFGLTFSSLDFVSTLFMTFVSVLMGFDCFFGFDLGLRLDAQLPMALIILSHSLII